MHNKMSAIEQSDRVGEGPHPGLPALDQPIFEFIRARHVLVGRPERLQSRKPPRVRANIALLGSIYAKKQQLLAKGS